VPRMASTPTFRENLLRVIAVIGLIAILLLGAWGIIKLAFYLPTFFSTWGKAKETLSVTIPAQSTSDKAFPISWKHTGKAEGEYSYSVSYTCAQGLAFAVPVPTGAFQLVPCDTQFNYINASSTMPLIPVLKDAARATTTLTVAATRLSDGTITVKGTDMTAVSASTTPASATPGSAYTPPAATTTKPAAATPKPAASTKSTTTYVPSGRTTNLYGAADLAVQITSAPAQANVGSRVTLQFVVTNIGTNIAPAGWMFNAILPYQPIYVYPSGGQQMLYPGDKIVYTLGYDVVPAQNGSYYGGQAQASIEIDPRNAIIESSKYNNTAVASYQVY
jgi:hypothetical protein